MLKILKKWLDQVFVNEESLVLLLLIAVSLTVLMSMGVVLAPVVLSIILAFMMQGLTTQLMARSIPRWLAVAIAFMVFVGSFLIALFVILPLAWQQMTKLFTELPAMLQQLRDLMQVLPDRYPGVFSHAQIEEWTVQALSRVGSVGQVVVSFSLSTIPNLLALLIYTVLVPILVFFFLKDRELLLSWLAGFLPSERPMLRKIWHEMNEQVGNYVRGKAVEILIVGVASYIAFVLLGLNYAALLAVLVGLSVVIPYIGAAVVTIPVLLIGFFQWGWGPDFLSLFIVYSVIQALDGNVLVPLLFSEAVNLHPVAIVLAVLVFGGFWGLWGVFFAIPLATLIKAMLNSWPVAENQA